MNKVNLQFIGTFHTFKKIELDKIEFEYFSNVANRLKSSLQDAILDPYFYHHLKLEKYQSFQDLKGFEIIGMDTFNFHQIEIFIDGKRQRKFDYLELKAENTFFPLFPIRSKVVSFDKDTFLIHQIEKGTMKFKDQYTKNFIDSLSFEMCRLDKFTVITSVFNNDISFKLNKMDTVVSYQNWIKV